MPQGKLVPRPIKEKVKDLLYKDSKLTGKELKAQVEAEPEFAETKYTERTYQNIKKEVLPQVHVVKAAVPERAWSLGALSLPEFSNLPSSVVRKIMEFQRIEKQGKDQALTIRQARWIARLYGIIGNNNDELREVVYIYSTLERAHELSGDPAPFDTSRYDIGLNQGIWGIRQVIAEGFIRVLDRTLGKQ